MPCELLEACHCASSEKPTCRNWIPGRGSRYAKCARFLATRATCDLPRTACQTCQHFVAKLPGRERIVNWLSPEAKKVYHTQYMKTYRKRKRRQP